MKLRARLLSISMCALLVPVLLAIAIAAGVAVTSSGKSQDARFFDAIAMVRKDIEDTERRYGVAITRLAESRTVQEKLYVYSDYWDYFSKDTRDGDIAVLRDFLEKYLLSESLDTIAAYRAAEGHYAPVVVVGNSTHISSTIPRDYPSGQPEYFQTSDGIYATFSMPVFRAESGEAIGFLILQKAFNRGYFENLSRRFNTGIALYTQGLYRFTNLPGISSAGALWANSHPATGGLFSGFYPYEKRIYKYVGYYFQMGQDAKGYLFVGGPSSITIAEWWAEFRSRSVLPLICVGIATVLFILWGSEVIRAIRTLLSASVKVGQGDHRVELPVGRRDEFGALYRGFTEMAENLEESRRRLVTSERMAALGSFSAGVAHEINNPMGIILNHVQLLRSGRLTEEERGQFLERVETEITRVNRLLRGLLHHATEEELSFADFALEKVVREVVGLFSPKMRLKGIEAIVDPFPPDLMIEGDADAVKQVLFNLLYNAAQAIHHDHGLVLVSAQADGAGTVVRVSDNGEGMDSATLARVFEPYFTRKQGYGTGLGLALSQKIMKRHGGTLSVESRVNEGTTITLTFPLKEGACQPEATTPF